MKLLMLWKYYPAYLEYFYQKNPGVFSLSYDEHQKKIFDDHFGWAADFGQYLHRKGIKTKFVIANAKKLQQQWCKENNVHKKIEKEIVLEQIKRFKPDILWVTSLFDYYGPFIQEALPHAKKVICWIGSPFIDKIDTRGFSALLTENPSTLKKTQHTFDQVLITKPGFDPAILDKIGSQEKKYDITFIGHFGHGHRKRMSTIKYLLEHDIKIKLFSNLPGNGQRLINNVKQSSFLFFRCREPKNAFTTLKDIKNIIFKDQFEKDLHFLQKKSVPPVFGLDMYKALAQSHLTLNVHIDCARNNAGNCRTFEATGAGTCLLNENAHNIGTLFTPNKEIMTYNNEEELIEKIKFLLANKHKAQRIAQAGQKRTLKEHTFDRVFNDIKSVF